MFDIDSIFPVPAWSKISNPYAFRPRGSDTVLITVGDSWTYGDSLGNTKVREGRDDTEYRLDHVYGNIISKHYNWDWINLALPGGSNEWMLDNLDRLLKQFLEYRKIVVVVTLTESGRHEELRSMDRGLITQQMVLLHLLARTYNKINQLKDEYPSVKFLVAHNFTDGAEGLLDLCDRSWLEVMIDKSIQKNTHIVVSDHINQMNYEQIFPDALDIIERAQSRIDLLDSCEYCYKEDSRHPNEQGHRLWAEYLITQIDEYTS